MSTSLAKPTDQTQRALLSLLQVLLSPIDKSRNVTLAVWCVVMSTLFSMPAHAESPDLTADGGDGGFFAGLTTLMQEWSDFLAGPFAIMFIFIGALAAVVLWIAAPKAGEIMGYGIRTVVGGWVMFNLGALIVYLDT